MSFIFKNHKIGWLVISFVFVFVLACGLGQLTVETPIEVTRIVRETQIVAPTIVEVTKLVEATPVVVVKTVEVVKEVVKTVIVEVEIPCEQNPSSLIPQTELPPAGDSLIVWYDFEGDFLSGLVKDRSGNGHDAGVVGSVKVAEGISGGQAIQFQGDGYIISESNPAAGRNIVSFALWFKTDQPKNNYKMASGAWWNGGPGSGWILATHIPEFWSDDTKSLFLPEPTNVENDFPAGEWVHEVVTYDGQNLREYTNGKLINDWSATGAAIGQGQAMVVGAWPPFSAYNYRGEIDEFKIFDWALTAQEVQTLFNER
jgi:hypothetical protein